VTHDPDDPDVHRALLRREAAELRVAPKVERGIRGILADVVRVHRIRCRAPVVPPDDLRPRLLVVGPRDGPDADDFVLLAASVEVLLVLADERARADLLDPADALPAAAAAGTRSATTASMRS
jgi:hypothetical protein